MATSFRISESSIGTHVIVSLCMIGLTLWLKFEPGFQEWVDFMRIGEYYIGIWILLVSGFLVFFVSIGSCAVTLTEERPLLLGNLGAQAFCFLLHLTGTTVLLVFSTQNSAIQPIIRDSMRNLISNSQHEHVSVTLRMIQENIGCCGADGPMDYLNLLKPLPTECRDTVTGNAFFHGCVDELTWFLETRSVWLAGVAFALCLCHVIIGVSSLVLYQALQKEEKMLTYKR
ncbi:tetraspanin-2A [Copidosoma floridanum]|uniref:tetraspanin-2A n=1 Tax=Copidosoma floridanum TaxID=29053 RepID=UPI000C6F4653|nr:tetraspanin-2A [Copidosoma floridanum]